MKNFLLILCFSGAFFFTACTQTKDGIRSSTAFFRISFPGNLPVDDNGNPLRGADTVRVIYIETNGKHLPDIKSVQYRDMLYSPAVFREERTPVVIGKGKKSHGELVMVPRSGNGAWRVELTPLKKVRDAGNKNIILKGIYNKKPFTRVIEKETELDAEIRG